MLSVRPEAVHRRIAPVHTPPRGAPHATFTPSASHGSAGDRDNDKDDHTLLSWLRKLFRRERPRIFLGALAVAPRSDFKRYFEYTRTHGPFDLEGWLNPKDIDTELRTALTDLFALPPVSCRETPRDSDLALDVIIPEFQAGQFLPINAGPVLVPIMWRPKVKVGARLYVIDTGETRSTHTVSEKLRWRETCRRVLSPKAIFWGSPAFSADDTKRLFYAACIKLLERVKRDV